MTKRGLNNWIMYHELLKFKRLSFINAKIAQHVVLNARAVRKYLNMDEEEYEQYFLGSCQRKKILFDCEDFVAKKLSKFHNTSIALMHDWLKEAHTDFPQISPRIMYNFVMFVHQKHNIPFVRIQRDYFPIEELPYGQQAQVDFGEYNMRLSNGKRKKVRFFVMVLSRSRMKYISFLSKLFTAETAA